LERNGRATLHLFVLASGGVRIIIFRFIDSLGKKARRLRGEVSLGAAFALIMDEFFGVMEYLQSVMLRTLLPLHLCNIRIFWLYALQKLQFTNGLFLGIAGASRPVSRMPAPPDFHIPAW
jgi:hypothetical protein